MKRARAHTHTHKRTHTRARAPALALNGDERVSGVEVGGGTERERRRKSSREGNKGREIEKASLRERA